MLIKKEHMELEKESEVMVFEVAGKEGVDVLKLLFGKKDVSEFILADKLKLTINQIRNILYKFDKYNLVSSSREKDKKKGWYIYFWTFEIGKAVDSLKQFKIQKLNKFKHQFEYEKAHKFFACPKKCSRLTFEAAMEHQFQCIECGQIMGPEDNSKIINKLNNDIEILERDIIEVETLRPKPVEEKPKKIVKKKIVKKSEKKIKKKVKKIVKKTKKIAKKKIVKKAKIVKKKKR